MEYTKLVSVLEAMDYDQFMGFGSMEPSEYLIFTVDIDEDDIIEMVGKSFFTKLDLMFPDVMQQVAVMNQQAVKCNVSKRVFVWGKW